MEKSIRSELTRINDGGQVYPAMTFKKSGAVEIGESVPGLTLRQFYAAKAMQAIISTPEEYSMSGAWEVAITAFKMADAMIAAELTSAEAQ